MSQLLITGGAGFIGSHTCVILLDAGHDLIVLDDFSNSSAEALVRVAELAGVELGSKRLSLQRADIRQTSALEQLFAAAQSRGCPIEAVVHFAGLKAVGESVQNPLHYWDVNVGGTVSLVKAMQEFGCRTLVFSSSATLYGYPDEVPIKEGAPIQPINPYGHTKAAVERLLNDLAASAPEQWRIACLRYFNPVGAHPSGRIGEDPLGRPNNLFPFVSQVAVGRRPEIEVFGGDWPTADGTCIRDYIHVMDLAEGHRAALSTLLQEPPQVLTLNLGSGHGASVLDVIQAFETACGRPIPHSIQQRRPGDAAITVADPAAAKERLGWSTRRNLHDICRDGWAWQSANPSGYGPGPASA
ncbi:UDP-glucose 4-epimerase [Synechococcus sp. PROS-7-1]|uniref:UDP-glucose 4-epimerase GalE n=1 Tax=Synechococcus sp. PROS-7-1 TaxID=1442556 RepID=UPI0016468CCD|nr:UDP-glucose 4-epimerase GalE [Synechococcus sp. PROS-7-1]QNI84106.1 UDP-glucose 4-epimerase [Synechococcus sp. PROS-7-1]